LRSEKFLFSIFYNSQAKENNFFYNSNNKRLNDFFFLESPSPILDLARFQGDTME